MTIGMKIAQLRKDKNLSQQALANALNVTRQTISKWENDLALPNIDDLSRLSDFFQVTLGDFLNQDIKKENDVEALYQQVQIVFEKTEKETKRRNYFNYLLIMICCISTIFTISTGYQIRDFNKLYHQQEVTTPERLSVNILDVEGLSEIFVGVSNTSGGGIPEGSTEMNTNKYDLQKRTVSLSYQFVLKDYHESTEMEIEFDGVTYPLEKVNQNTFVFNEEIPLKNYDHVIVKVKHPDSYVEEADIGKDKNCYYLTFVLYATTSFYLPVDYGPNLVELNKINYILDPTREILQRYVGFRFNTGNIKLDIYGKNGELLVTENFDLGKKEEKELDSKLPVDETLKIIATITVDNQEVVLSGTLVPTKKSDDRVYVVFDKIAGMT